MTLQLMAILPIYLYGTDALRKKAKPVSELDDALVRLVYDMFETMRKAGGIGLAATQVGEMKRVIVVDISAALEDEAAGPSDLADSNAPATSPVPEGVQTLVIINPEIVTAEGSWMMEEGCLSIPGIRGDVVRAKTIRVRFLDANLKPVELAADGLLARVILHEIDHLDGVLFIDHLSSAKRTLLKSKLNRIKKGDVEVSYPVVTAAEGRAKQGRAARVRIAEA
jgi:peptide deformylase